MNQLKPIKVKITNFQSIESLDFEIQGFTCLVGKTNIGKSAIIRAISSSILNNPVVGMVRSGANFATVEMTSQDWGYKWEKGERGINRYTIDGKVLDKVGAKQLPEIANFGFKSVSIGHDEIYPWLASQFFPIFLLDKPGSQVTDFISEVSRLNVLQDAITLSVRGRKKSNDEVNRNDNELKEINDKLSKLTGLEELENLDKDLEQQFLSINKYLDSISKLESLITKINDLSAAVSRLEKISNAKVPDIIDVNDINKINQGKNLEQRLILLASGIKKINKISKFSVPKELDEMGNYVKLHEILRKLNKLDIKLDPNNIFIPDDISDLNEVRKLSSIEEVMIQDKNKIIELKGKLQDVDKDLNDINDKIMVIPLCPTCDRPHSSGH